MQRTFTKVILGIVATIGMVGIAAPRMVSSENDVTVMGGFGLIIAWLWIMLFPLGIAKKIASLVNNVPKNSNSLLLVLGIVMMFGMSACSRVSPGNVGIKVKLLGAEKGVTEEVLEVGQYWIGMNEELYIFPTFTQTYSWTQDSREGSRDDESMTFQTNEGLEVSGDFSIIYKIEREKIVTLFQTYRCGIDEITGKFLRTIVRNELNQVTSKLRIEDVYGSGKEAMMAEVNTRCKAIVAEKGIMIESISIIGKLRLPPVVVESLNAKLAATQKALQIENEVQGARAEAEKTIAAAKGEADSALLVATAKAEANRLLTESLTPELIQYETIQKWDGRLSVYSSGGAATPLIQLPALPSAK